MKIKIEFETEYKKVKPKCHVSTINDGASFDLEKTLTVDTEWYSKQNPKPPSEYTPCLELRHHGIWSLEISTPIWKMIMEQWINDKTDS